MSFSMKQIRARPLSRVYVRPPAPAATPPNVGQEVTADPRLLAVPEANVARRAKRKARRQRSLAGR